MTVAVIKNWADFQHYKDRSPPWIKLHRGLLDDFTFQRLPVASRALAPMLWLLAAESSDGSLCIDAEQLAFRLRTEEKEIVGALKPLIEKGFLIIDSALLAKRKRDACPEGEGEGEGERETEERKKSAAPKKPAQAAIAVELQTWLDTPRFSAMRKRLAFRWTGWNFRGEHSCGTCESAGHANAIGARITAMR
jgi:hypothetical protein